MFLAQVRELAIKSGNTELQLALLKYDAPLSRKPTSRRKKAAGRICASPWGGLADYRAPERESVSEKYLFGKPGGVARGSRPL
jgi:hypothetical protein